MRSSAGSRSPLLGLVVDRLAEGSERRGPGRAWRIDRRRLTPESRKRHPRGLVDLGLAHGVPGALVVLAGAAAAGVARARPLLDYAVAFLLAQRLPDGCVARFAVADSLREPARAAWCYGDAGIALALLLAARAVGERQWEREAVAIGRVAARRPPSTSGVKDAALCHGAAGLAHLFHRLYRATGERIFRDAALVWFRETLAMRRAGVGVAGYRAFTDRWVDDAGFLTGAAGIGLALLGASTRTEPSWDRVLLCSLASPGLL